MNTDPQSKDTGHAPSPFDRVARSYDQMTRLNPGYHRHLVRSAERLRLPSGGRVLDLCCGTGLSTQAIARVHPDVEIVGLDASEGMLAKARTKALGPRVQFVRGDAMDPAAAGVQGPFDGILMAYGIRNVPDPDLCLMRLWELLRPGGRICLHEYSVADSWRSRLVWNAVTLGVIIPAGLVVSGTTDIYRYLRNSVRHFDGVRELQSRLARTGFRDLQVEPMDGWQRGIVHSFLGTRPQQ
jgi:ubiquinone/menaquinone biosynthesis C-methylase UbiE